MSKRTYSSPTPGHPKRFMKMPRAEKPKAEPKPPRHPSRRMLIGRLCQHTAKEHMDTDCGPWSTAAFDVWWWLSDIRDKHARHASR